MVCEKNGICDFINHIEKLVAELPSGKERKEFEESILEIEREFCTGCIIGQDVYYDGVMKTVGCGFHDVACCPRFPCETVKSRRLPLVFVSDDEFLRLCSDVSTSMGTGKCAKMRELDFETIFSGKTDITLSRPVEEKFKGL